jgi:hypothetical protein
MFFGVFFGMYTRMSRFRWMVRTFLSTWFVLGDISRFSPGRRIRLDYRYDGSTSVEMEGTNFLEDEENHDPTRRQSIPGWRARRRTATRVGIVVCGIGCMYVVLNNVPRHTEKPTAKKSCVARKILPHRSR